MSGDSERKRVSDLVASYHADCLAELVAHVSDAIDAFRAGRVDVHAVDEVLFQYHRAAGELWKFCWGTGSSAQLELAASIIDEHSAKGTSIGWWAQGAPRRR